MRSTTKHPSPNYTLLGARPTFGAVALPIDVNILGGRTLQNMAHKLVCLDIIIAEPTASRFSIGTYRTYPSRSPLKGAQFVTKPKQVLSHLSL